MAFIRLPTQGLRQPVVLVTILSAIIILLTITADLRGNATTYMIPAGWRPGAPLQETDPAVSKRLSAVRKRCRAPDPFESKYGRANLRMTRSYEGSQYRVERFINKIIRNEPVVIGIVGGSVTRGHGVEEHERWSNQLQDLLGPAYPGANITIINGAIPASGSDYFSFCFPLHIPTDVDLVFVELAVNDEALMEHSDNMDNLIRSLLALPNEPAVVLVEVVAFSNGVMAGSGGRMHLSVAQYYDVPVLNQRWPLVSHFARFPELVPHYFVPDWWSGYTDLRHIGPAGHRDMANIIGSFLRDVTCDMITAEDYVVAPREDLEPLLPVQDFTGEHTYHVQLEDMFGPDLREISREVSRIQSGWPSETKQWEHEPDDKDIEIYEIKGGRQFAPGLWTASPELGMIPRLRAMEPWNNQVSYSNPIFRPVCLSTRSPEPQFNLTPTANDGWYWWVHPELPDKPYLVADKPGATVSFELKVNVGIIKMYSLRSMTYGFGMIDCWIDENVEHKVTIDGYWDNPDLNIGRFTTLGEDLKPGVHKITCTLRSDTHDPEGRTFFRIISVMGR